MDKTKKREISVSPVTNIATVENEIEIERNKYFTSNRI